MASKEKQQQSQQVSSSIIDVVLTNVSEDQVDAILESYGRLKADKSANCRLFLVGSTFVENEVLTNLNANNTSDATNELLANYNSTNTILLDGKKLKHKIELHDVLQQVSEIDVLSISYVGQNEEQKRVQRHCRFVKPNCWHMH